MRNLLRVYCVGALAAFLLALPAAAATTPGGAQHQNEQKRHTVYSKWSGVRSFLPTQLSNASSASRRSNRAGEVIDEHGVIVEPAEGVLKTYERTGQGMYGEDYGDGMFLAFESQDGTIDVVECTDGTVYFKDLIYAFQRGYWVKGTKAGNTITIAANQPLAYSPAYNASVVLRWAHGVGDGTVEEDNTHGDTFTFTVGDDGSLTLDDTSEFKYMGENYFMGVFWNDNSEFAAFGDALTVYKPVNIVTQVDELPYANDFSTLGDQKSFTIVDGNEDIELYPVDYTNDPIVIARQYRMVSINSCLEVDLMGQVASETIGMRQYSGIGGQIDFIRGASMSREGKSIIAMPSTAAKGTISRIKPFLTPGSAVSTTRNDVNYLVTEYGIARLKGRTLQHRAEDLIRIAHPDFRPMLIEEYERRFQCKYVAE